jgi:hypothetical protein
MEMRSFGHKQTELVATSAEVRHLSCSGGGDSMRGVVAWHAMASASVAGVQGPLVRLSR